MATEGTFNVVNKAGVTITGHVSHKNHANEAVYFSNLGAGDSTAKQTWRSGAGTHDSWYWVISINGAAPKTGSFGCALYDEDENQNTEIHITGDKIEVCTPVSSHCTSEL